MVLGIAGPMYDTPEYLPSLARYPAVPHAKVDLKAIPLAVTFIGCGQITGITMALTISNSVFLNQATNRIAKVLPLVPRATVQQAITGVDGLCLKTLNAADRVDVLHAVVESISRVYPMVIAAGGVAVILSPFMKRECLFVQAAVKDSEKQASN
ncbi:MAG: hypothetical protein FRX48_04301 [Lasallia pustulata]|uniref:Uncharacterized protein n=1 Tax=Lasallia pustulata TaxID=136370 RepID=A0A5M8PT36_9LECA|nr:MAG: hypothetical protein FRX48_04301 [Lasallia pustulata]